MKKQRKIILRWQGQVLSQDGKTTIAELQNGSQVTIPAYFEKDVTIKFTGNPLGNGHFIIQVEGSEEFGLVTDIAGRGVEIEFIGKDECVSTLCTINTNSDKQRDFNEFDSDGRVCSDTQGNSHIFITYSDASFLILWKVRKEYFIDIEPVDVRPLKIYLGPDVNVEELSRAWRHRRRGVKKSNLV